MNDQGPQQQNVVLTPLKSPPPGGPGSIKGVELSKGMNWFKVKATGKLIQMPGSWITPENEDLYEAVEAPKVKAGAVPRAKLAEDLPPQEKLAKLSFEALKKQAELESVDVAGATTKEQAIVMILKARG